MVIIFTNIILEEASMIKLSKEDLKNKIIDVHTHSAGVALG